MHTVSIIVPAYNVQDYLSQCLSSLIIQSLTDTEIIVVDDGSTDRTLEIANDYQSRCSNIQVISQSNAGLSGARNTGIAHARGKYIGFVDSDDWVDAEMFRLMYLQAEESDSELVICNGYRYDHMTRELTPYWNQSHWRAVIRNRASAAFCASEEPQLFLIEPVVHTRLYRRDLLERTQFKFPVGLIYEDMPGHFQLPLQANRVSMLDRQLYFYRVNRNGQITSWRNEKNLQVLAIFEIIYQILDSLAVPPAIWAAAIKFQLRYIVGMRGHLNDEIGTRLVEGWQRQFTRIPRSGMDLFYESFPEDRFAYQCVRDGWQEWIKLYGQGKPTVPIVMFLMSRTAMWPVIASVMRRRLGFA